MHPFCWSRCIWMGLGCREIDSSSDGILKSSHGNVILYQLQCRGGASTSQRINTSISNRYEHRICHPSQLTTICRFICLLSEIKVQQERRFQFSMESQSRSRMKSIAYRIQLQVDSSHFILSLINWSTPAYCMVWLGRGNKVASKVQTLHGRCVLRSTIKVVWRHAHRENKYAWTRSRNKRD